MDENAYLSTLTNFYQSALNWATPSFSASPNPRGTPAIATGPGTFDINSANATTVGTSNYLAGLNGQYNQNFAFLLQTFDRSTAFLNPVLNDVTRYSAQVSNKYADAAIIYAKNNKRKRGLFSKVFG